MLAQQRGAKEMRKGNWPPWHRREGLFLPQYPALSGYQDNRCAIIKMIYGEKHILFDCEYYNIIWMVSLKDSS